MGRFLLKILCVLAFSSEVAFAGEFSPYTILHDNHVRLTSGSAAFYTDSYIREVSRMISLTKMDMHRKKVQDVPPELERFYEDGFYKYDLKNVMSIDSEEGLRVRSEPSLNSSKICTLPEDFNVVVTCLGPEATIDGIKSAWVEILLPRYLWSGLEAEFGWVFGGYLKERITFRKNFYLKPQNRHYEDYESDSYLPYNSPALYDIVQGISVFDRYCTERTKNSDRTFGNSSEYTDEVRSRLFEYKIKTALEILKLTYSGVIPNNSDNYYFSSQSFHSFWDLVQEKRQIHPVYHWGTPVPEYTRLLTDETIFLDLMKGSLVYTSPKSEKSITVEIPADYSKDFSVTAPDELEVCSYESDAAEFMAPIVMMKKKIYENEAVYHYDVFYYYIREEKLIKILQITTCPDIFDTYFWGVYISPDSDKERFFNVDSTYTSIIYGMIHDDCISFTPSPLFPYFQIAKDCCHNYEIIQIGPNYNRYSR